MEKKPMEGLRVWRRKQAVIVLGQPKVWKWGDRLFMSGEVVQRIVNCAHDGRENHYR